MKKRSFALAIPLTIQELSGFNAGVSLRVGPLFLGSGSILSTLFRGDTKQADFHFGLSVGVLEKRKKQKYKEPKEPTIIEDVKPVAPIDTDSDGVVDSIDKCPTIPGLAKYHGCPIPDSDSDGINDEEDSCPYVRGLVKYHGCPIPDSDSDGVNDEEDSCPHYSGYSKISWLPNPGFR
ncbi:MAG: thrombospondin type 3 repeat-containing protein [Ferruginibacter sp.]